MELRSGRVCYTGSMPLYEYSCRACGHQFELLVRHGIEPVCPACRAEDVEKVFSVFAVGASSPKQNAMPNGGACAHCPNPGGPGCSAVES